MTHTENNKPVEDWEEKLENLKCINGSMYFGSVEEVCSGRDAGECCHYEQTFYEAITELKNFIRETREQAKKEERERILKDLYENIYVETLAGKDAEEVAKYVKGFFKIAITDYAKQYGIEF